MSAAWETLLPVLVHIQANLDGDLSLGALGQKAGLSPWYLHRLFRTLVGETPKSYVARLRLERGAFRLLIHDATLLEIALECGFHNHETFTRAFRRRFGRSPSDYRNWIKRQDTRSQGPARDVVVSLPARFELSATKVVRLRPMHLAFIRHVGPYAAVPNTIFDELAAWAATKHGLGQTIWMGIGHDAPASTPPHQLRFDAAVVVSAPFAPEGHIGYQQLSGGEFAVTTHVGPFDTLPAAYAAIFPRVMALPGYQVLGLPAIEIYHTAVVNIDGQLNHTDICLPVVRYLSS